MKQQLRLLNTKMVEKDNICLMLSLYLHISDGKCRFSYYSSYMGFGIDKEDLMEDGIPKINNILSGTQDIYGIDLNSEELKTRIEELIQEMENMQFEDAFQIIANYQNKSFV